MKERVLTIAQRGSRIRKGVLCHQCKEAWAVEYYRPNSKKGKAVFVCARCLNPEPSKEYLEREKIRYLDLKSSLGIME
jgi:hypothetical protein